MYCEGGEFKDFVLEPGFPSLIDPSWDDVWIPLGKCWDVPELSKIRAEVYIKQIDADIKAKIEEQNKLLAEIEAKKTEDHRKTLTITLDDGREMRIDITIIGKAEHQSEAVDQNPTKTERRCRTSADSIIRCVRHPTDKPLHQTLSTLIFSDVA